MSVSVVLNGELWAKRQRTSVPLRCRSSTVSVNREVVLFVCNGSTDEELEGTSYSSSREEES